GLAGDGVAKLALPVHLAVAFYAMSDHDIHTDAVVPVWEGDTQTMPTVALAHCYDRLGKGLGLLLGQGLQGQWRAQHRRVGLGFQGQRTVVVVGVWWRCICEACDLPLHR
ncbi:MAG: hypothetical protein AAFX99_11920, partial [Myxococcota bacterium]